METFSDLCLNIYFSWFLYFANSGLWSRFDWITALDLLDWVFPSLCIKSIGIVLQGRAKVLMVLQNWATAHGHGRIHQESTELYWISSQRSYEDFSAPEKFSVIYAMSYLKPKAVKLQIFSPKCLNLWFPLLLIRMKSLRISSRKRITGWRGNSGLGISKSPPGLHFRASGFHSSLFYCIAFPILFCSSIYVNYYVNTNTASDITWWDGIQIKAVHLIFVSINDSCYLVLAQPLFSNKSGHLPLLGWNCLTLRTNYLLCSWTLESIDIMSLQQSNLSEDLEWASR